MWGCQKDFRADRTAIYIENGCHRDGMVDKYIKLPVGVDGSYIMQLMSLKISKTLVLQRLRSLSWWKIQSEGSVRIYTTAV